MFVGHRAREGSSNPVWQDFLDYGTVARGLQATQSQSQSQSQSHSHPAHETPPARDQTEIQHQPDEAAEHEEAAAPAGISRSCHIFALHNRCLSTNQSDDEHSTLPLTL